LGLQKLAEFGVKKALVTCDDKNLASAKTIEGCGGILENSIFDPVEKRLTRRYWIEIK
jgi:predicted acetyltransferase